MNFPALSPREDEIVALAAAGHTNKGIASTLGIGIGTVNTYWQRIRAKVGGLARTDTVAKVLIDQVQRPNRDDSDVHMPLQIRAAQDLFRLATRQARSTMWAVDSDLRIRSIANVQMPARRNGVLWEVGKTVYEIFKTNDPSHPAVAAHLQAIGGEEAYVRLNGEMLRAVPLVGGNSDGRVGCIGVLSDASRKS